MAKRSKNVATVDFTERATEVAKARLDAINAMTKQRRDLQRQIETIDKQILSQVGVASTDALAKVDLQSPAAPVAGRTGRKTTSKNGSSKGGRKVSINSLPALMVRHALPNPDQDGIDKDTIYSHIENEYTTKSDNPTVLVNQALTRLKGEGFAEAAMRGHWRLTKAGVAERDRLEAEATKEVSAQG